MFYPFVAAYFILRKRINLPVVITSLLTIWLIFEFIGVNVPGIYARPHFKHLLPVMSLMSGIAVVHIATSFTISLRQVLIAVWILFIPKVTDPLYALIAPTNYVRTGKFNPPYPRSNETEEKQLGLWIKEHTGENDRVLVAGFGARVQLYSQRLSPSIYFNVTQTPLAKDRFMKEVNSNKPAMIVIPVFPDYQVHVGEDLRAFIDSLAKKEYRMEKEHLYGYAVYRRATP